MYVNGRNYRLTKHGRKRYIKRIGQETDKNILKNAIHGLQGYEFIWQNDRKHKKDFRLITVYYADITQNNVY